MTSLAQRNISRTITLLHRSPSVPRHGLEIVCGLLLSITALGSMNAAARDVPNIAAADGSLRVWPERIEFADAFARRQLLVSRGGRDVTRDASYHITPPEVARVSPRGFIEPLADGHATLTVTAGGQSCDIPLDVHGLAQVRAVDFATEIVPLLSRFGCNAGGCHGKARGQNGFKLSLFGFDTAFDYEAIVTEARGRRIFAAVPEKSLFLAKATGQIPHGGGQRIAVGSEPYRLIMAWIQAGAPASAPDTPRVNGLEIVPRERTLVPGEEQQLAVLAHYTDGSSRDVTGAAEFSSNFDLVATVNEGGLARAQELTGEATIMARYMGQVAVFRALRPQGAELASLNGFQPRGRIDELAAAKWKKLGIEPSPACDDDTFLRRVTIDLSGRLPTVDEARAFLADPAGDRREKLVDRLLETSDHAAYFANKWGSILRNSSLAGSEKAAYAFHGWLQQMIAENRPYDEFVRGIVAASGEWQDSPAINWYWQSRDDQLHQVTSDTAQVFLGLRLQCAKCHHHPYERWGQDDYFGLAGFFTRVGRKSFGEPPPYFSSPSPTMEALNPTTGKPAVPKYLDGELAVFSPEDDPRHGLVDWMARPENPFFAKALVNRLWGHFLGRGLVDQIDDLRETNPPSNPELLDDLAKDFVEHHFDVRRVIRRIVNSQTYQLTADPQAGNRQDQQNFARFYARRLTAEVAHDAVNQACGTTTQFNNMGSQSRAIDLPHERFGSYFLDAFDRPKRVSGCECERSTSATLAQVLLLSNSDEIENKLMNGEGRVQRLIKAETPTPAAVEELYLAAFSRFPTETERTQAIEYVDRKSPNRDSGLQDLLWALVNSREFLFNH